MDPEYPDVATCLENYAFLLQTMGPSGESSSTSQFVQ